jgi:hypothetical protein
MLNAHLALNDHATGDHSLVIERSVTSGSAGFSVLATVGPYSGGGARTYDDATVAAGDNWFRIKAVNADGESAYSNVAHVSVVPIFDADDYSGLLRWYKPDPIGVSDGAALPSWPDSSPANDPAVQATGANQPIYHATGGPNNKPHVTFDGSNDFLQFTRFTTVRTAYVLVKHASGSSSYPVMLGDDSTYPFAGETGTTLFADGSDPTTLTGGQLFVNGRLARHHLEKKPSAYTLYVLKTVSPVALKYIFNDRSAYFWPGDFVEGIVYSSLHNKTDHHAIVAYFAAAGRYNLSVAIQSQPPANTKFLISGNSILQEGTIVGLLLQAMNPANTAPNWAIAGETTQGMATNAPSSEDLGYDGGMDFNVLIAWEITNDLANTDLSSTSTAAAAAQAYTDIKNYYLARKAAHAAVKVVAVTCLPRNSNLSGTNMTPAAMETMRLLVNASMVANWPTFADALADVGGDAELGAWFTDRVGNLKITNGGSGYSSSFAVSFTGGGGSGAAGTVTASGGVITDVMMTNNGAGYTSAPTPDFSAGGGSGAAGTAQLGANDSTLYADGTHPNGTGKALIATILIAAVGSLDLGT